MSDRYENDSADWSGSLPMDGSSSYRRVLEDRSIGSHTKQSYQLSGGLDERPGYCYSTTSSRAVDPLAASQEHAYSDMADSGPQSPRKITNDAAPYVLRAVSSSRVKRVQNPPLIEELLPDPESIDVSRAILPAINVRSFRLPC